jgi:hypothetical protein
MPASSFIKLYEKKREIMETIIIPRRFEINLRRKFAVGGFSRFRKGYVNTTNCELCREYMRNDDCTQCPFEKLGNMVHPGCYEFLQKGKDELKLKCLILLSKRAVYVDKIKNFKKIMEYVGKFIKFEDE